MTEVISAWRSNIRGSFSGYLGNTRVRRNPGVNPTYTIDLDDSDFNTALPMDEILLDSATPSMEISQPRLRIILIPSPPPLPSHEMLVAATRQLHPHTFKSSTIADELITPDDPSAIGSSDTTDTATQEGLIQCCVCMENRETEYYPTIPITDNCWHPNLTCLRCLEYSIASDHSSKMWDDIRCPQCAQHLSYQNVKNFADENTFAHYDELTTRQSLLKVHDFVWCTSCPSGQFHITTPNCAEVVCNACSATTCFRHRVPWHKGLTCNQYDRLIRHSTLSNLKSTIVSFSSSSQRLSSESSRKPDDGKAMTQKILGHKREAQASMRGIKRECKKCPGVGCGAMIYKIDGCKHMTCFNCTHEFCWRCKTDWFYGHKCWMPWRKA